MTGGAVRQVAAVSDVTAGPVFFTVLGGRALSVKSTPSGSAGTLVAEFGVLWPDP